MKIALNEIKIQAKKLLKTLKSDGKATLHRSLKKLSLTTLDELKLKHCLTIVSQQLGFTNWHHAQEVLSGDKKQLDALDMGTFFYPDSGGVFINEWFASYSQAKTAFLDKVKPCWLLPYKNQFIVVTQDYINIFKFDKKLTLLWSDVDNNMVEGYNSLAWDKITCEIIKNRQASF
jgi:hypothetical protein